MYYQFRPVDQWPGTQTPSRSQRRSQFRAGYQHTLDLLEKELRFLQAKNIVIQAYVDPRDIRLDGMLRSDVRPKTSGVILSFDSKFGSLSYPSDRYTDWQDNLRAIALAMEALRAVDRYGVTKRGEQYKGWAKLPSPNDAPMGIDEAVLVVSAASGMNFDHNNRTAVENAIRHAEMRTHPDRGGNSTEFIRVQRARAALLGASR